MENLKFFNNITEIQDLSPNCLINADCLVAMQHIASKSIDMILCDLPYGTTACKWDIILPFEQLWQQYERIIKDNGAIILFGSHPFASELILSNKKLFKYDLIWEKDKPTNFALANKRPMCYHENIMVFYKEQCTYNKQMEEREGKGTFRYNFDISHENREIQGTNIKYCGKKQKSNYDIKYKNPKSILYFDTGQRQQLIHPTQKPLELFKYLIRTYSNENEVVLDNCCGAGTTALACVDTNRRFICIDNGICENAKSIYNGMSWAEITRQRLLAEHVKE